MIRRIVLWVMALMLVAFGFNISTAAPSISHQATLTGYAACTTTGWDATFTATNDAHYGHAVLSNTGVGLDGLYDQGQSKTVTLHESSATASVTAGPATMEWYDHYIQNGIGSKVVKPNNCTTVTALPPTPAVTDPCGAGNAEWDIPASDSDFSWTLNSDGHLVVTILTSHVTFPDGLLSHDYGVAPETNTNACPVTTKHGYVKWDKENSCKVSERVVQIYQRQGVASVKSWNNANRTRWTKTIVMKPHYVIRKNKHHDGRWVHRTTYHWSLKNIRHCGNPSPGSG